MVKPVPGLRFPAQLGLLGPGRTFQQFAPHGHGNSLIQAMVPRSGADVVEDDGDPFRIPDRVRTSFEAGNVHDLALPRGHEPHQDGVDPIDPGPPRRQFSAAHSAGRSPTARAPAAPCR